MLTYSTNPERDAARYEAACEWEQAMQDARIKTLYDDTIDQVAKGDFSRLYESMDIDPAHIHTAFDALKTCATAGSPAAKRAIKAMAQTFADHHAKP